jgi:hypothetical protein
MIPTPPKCFKCKHFLSKQLCKAFPNGIPKEIYFEKRDHTEPFEGDNGIRFEEKELDKR